MWTDDVDAALAIGGRIDTGTCYMNRCDYVDPALAWTGVKDSGRGVSLSPLGFDAVTRPQSFHLHAFPGHAGRGWPLPRWRSVARTGSTSPTCGSSLMRSPATQAPHG